MLLRRFGFWIVLVGIESLCRF